MKTKEEIIALIKAQPNKELIYRDISLDLDTDNQGEVIKCFYGGIVLTLWSHYGSDINNFYVTSMNNGFEQINSLITIYSQLAEFVGFDLHIDNTITLQKDVLVEKVVEVKNEKDAGKVEAYENILLKRNITIS